MKFKLVGYLCQQRLEILFRRNTIIAVAFIIKLKAVSLTLNWQRFRSSAEGYILQTMRQSNQYRTRPEPFSTLCVCDYQQTRAKASEVTASKPEAFTKLVNIYEVNESLYN